MKKNEIRRGICVDYTNEGLGIVKSDDFVFFIKNVLIHEEIEFVITKVNKRYGYGKCLKVITPSIHRVTPFCEYYGKCGGCQLQHMDLYEELNMKKKMVNNILQFVSKKECQVDKMVDALTERNYRNKAQFPVSLKEGVKIGFYRLHSNDIIDMNYCAIQSELINEIMIFIKTYFKEKPFADVFRHILIKHAFHTNQVMVVFIVRKKEIVGLDELVMTLTKGFSQIKSVILNVNERKDNVILGEKEYVLYGSDKIIDTLDNLSFLISSKSFYQVNPVQTQLLYQNVLDFASLSKEDVVVDLYCGVGTISLFLAKQAKKVIGVEIVEAAIQDAKENAKMNQIENVDFICSDASRYAQSLAKSGMKIDVVVVDPPRKGCDEITLSSIHTMNPKRIVYVSCNPNTLARDMNVLETYGYECKQVNTHNMFNNSFHVETIALFENNTYKLRT